MFVIDQLRKARFSCWMLLLWTMIAALIAWGASANSFGAALARLVTASSITPHIAILLYGRNRTTSVIFAVGAFSSLAMFASIAIVNIRGVEDVADPDYIFYSPVYPGVYLATYFVIFSVAAAISVAARNLAASWMAERDKTNESTDDDTRGMNRVDAADSIEFQANRS